MKLVNQRGDRRNTNSRKIRDNLTASEAVRTGSRKPKRMVNKTVAKAAVQRSIESPSFDSQQTAPGGKRHVEFLEVSFDIFVVAGGAGYRGNTLDRNVSTP
jgi:hypothetical protein